MEIYILKSVGCLAILFIFYKVVLERESFHNFKRFYLLGSLAAAFIIPLITFTQYVEVTESTVTFLSSEGPLIITEQPTPNVPFALISIWAIYGAGLVFFGMKFFRNLEGLITKIRKNPNLKSKNIFHVLLQSPTIPHTFLQYIFLNKTKFENNEIPKEVLIHEEAHAVQKHSIDVLLIELLQVIFWFNPLLYFMKRSIKLNHEFLADKAVLEQGVETSRYQTILLAFSSSATTPILANSINYSFIKKRFTVMKNQTSKRSTWLKSLLALPLLALITYGFSTTETITKIASNSKISSENTLLQNDDILSTNHEEHFTARSISIEILDNGFMKVEGIKIPKKQLFKTLESLNTDITKKQRDKIINIHVSSEGDISYDDLLFIQKVGTAYGYHRIVTPKEEIIRSKGNVPMAQESEIVTHKDYASFTQTIAEKATPEQLAKYNSMARYWNNYFEETNKHIMPLDQLKELETLYRTMDANQKESAAPFPDCDLTQTSATRAEMAEYDKLAKKYNNQKDGNNFILKKDVERLKYIYSKMSSKQRADAEPFPKFPPPPPSPDAPAPEVIMGVNDGDLGMPPPPPAPAPKPIKVVKGVNDFETDIPPPPPPPAPEEPLDHIVSMAKKGASFYYEGKKVSSDKAIELLKKNDGLNIQTTQVNSKNPQVRISKKPIVVDANNQTAENYKRATEDAVAQIKKLAAEGAHFLLFDGGPHFKDGQKITSERAIEIVKKVNGLTIDVLDDGYIYKIVEIKMEGC